MIDIYEAFSHEALIDAVPHDIASRSIHNLDEEDNDEEEEEVLTEEDLFYLRLIREEEEEKKDDPYYPCPNCADAVDKMGPNKDKCFGCFWTPTDKTYTVNKRKKPKRKKRKR